MGVPGHDCDPGIQSIETKHSGLKTKPCYERPLLKKQKVIWDSDFLGKVLHRHGLESIPSTHVNTGGRGGITNPSDREAGTAGPRTSGILKLESK